MTICWLGTGLFEAKDVGRSVGVPDGRSPGTAGNGNGKGDQDSMWGSNWNMESRGSGTAEGNNNDGPVETGGEKSKMRPDPQL